MEEEEEEETLTKITGILRGDQFTFFILFRSFLLRIRNVSDTIVGTIKTNILCSVTVSERMWKSRTGRR
jgi:hypothetical protein